MLITIKALFILLNILCGAYDFSFYRIPNMLILAYVVLFAFFAPLYLAPDAILYSLAVAGGVLAVSFTLYVGKIIGAGDVKYITVISLWAGSSDIMAFLFYMAIFGGVLALIYLFFRDYLTFFSDKLWQSFQKLEASFPFFEKVWMGSEKGAEKGKRQIIEAKKIPYGIAVASAAIIIIGLH